MRITIIGAGYVGLVTGACLAETGNDVVCVDKDKSKVEQLRQGVIPIHEPGLDGLVQNNVQSGRLKFTTGLAEAVRPAQVIFIAVGTPPLPDGSADLDAVDQVAAEIGRAMNGPKIVVNKSTVPVGTSARVQRIIAAETEHGFTVVSNPEFLKEGAAIEDFMKPDRVVIGSDDPEAIDVMKQIYSPYLRRHDRILVMDPASAEMTKYASNSMLATRISFMNEIAGLCDKVGANINQVRRGMASDGRIGGHFLFPGVGFGGSCFPKDLLALRHTGEENGVPMRILDSVSSVNRDQKRVLVDKVKAHFGNDLTGKVFGVWGLSFKPGTDDMREAPAVEIVNGLLEAGAAVRGHDPVAADSARAIFEGRLELHDDPYEAVKGADGLLLVTEWLSYRNPDFERIHDSMRTKVIFDGRNIWHRPRVERGGFAYHGIGV